MRALSDEEMGHVRTVLQRHYELCQNQDDVATLFGIRQPQVSKILKGDTSYRLSRATAYAMAKQSGTPVDELLNGTKAARGAYEELDQMYPERGKALDVLSRIYGDEFTRAMFRKSVPEGAESWTSERWAEEIMFIRKLWRDGHLDIPGLPSPTKLSPGNPLKPR